MIRRPPRSTRVRSSAASDVYKRQGFERVESADMLKGGTAEKNAEILKSIISGEQGVRRDIVLLNAGAALYAVGVADSIKAGVGKAAESIDSGAAGAKLESFITATAGKS